MRRLWSVAILLALFAILGRPGIVAEEAVPLQNSGILYGATTTSNSLSSEALSSDTPGGDVVSHVPILKETHASEDSYTSPRWGVRKIEVPQAWQVARGSESVLVAVLDTGIDEDNQDLAAKVLARVNFSESETSDDLYGHGTHMAGTIAAIAPECQLMNVKVANDAGGCRPSVVARGIVWAVDHGAAVINISLCMGSSPELEEAVSYAWNRGVVLVAAAGNAGKSTLSYPACYANCIAVAATDEQDSLVFLSNHGDWVDVAAPGANIYSAMPQDSYGYKSGTSSAAAHVSAVAALVLPVAEDSSGNGVLNDEVRQAIENSCCSIDDDGVGRGRISAFKAVMEIISSC